MEISLTWVTMYRAKWAGCGCPRSSSSMASRRGCGCAGTDEEDSFFQKARRWSLIRTATCSGMVGCWTIWMSIVFNSAPDHQQGLIVQYSFKNASDRARRLRFQLSVKTDLRPGWYSDHLGIRDGQDVVDWQSETMASSSPRTWTTIGFASGVRYASARMRNRSTHPPPIRTSGRGVTAASDHTVTVGAAWHLHPDLRHRRLDQQRERRR